MMDRLGALAVASRSDRRLEFALTRTTAWVGWLLAFAALAILPVAWSWWRPAAVVPGALGGLALAMITARRRLIFDCDDGLFRLEQRVFGLRSRLALPLFHLRRVVVTQRGRWFVTYVERRVGGEIRLEESLDAARVYDVAQAVCDVTKLRLTDELVF